MTEPHGGSAALGRTLREHVWPHVQAMPRLVIAIAGESGSGKSVTAEALAQALDAAGCRAVILHLDNYFFRPPRTNHEHRLADLANVGPHEVNLARLMGDVMAFRDGAAGVRAPVVDYPANRFLEETISFLGARVLIVEGTYAHHLPGIDFRIFLDATHHDTAERRRARNRDIDVPIMDDILAIEHAIVAPYRERAHVVIDRSFTITHAPSVPPAAQGR